MAIVRMILEPFPVTRCLLLQAIQLGDGLLVESRLGRTRIVIAMPLDHGLGGGFQLPGLPQEILARTAAPFGGIGRQLDAIDGKHLPSDEPLAVSDRHDLGDAIYELITQSSIDCGDGCEMRHLIA